MIRTPSFQRVQENRQTPDPPRTPVWDPIGRQRAGNDLDTIPQDLGEFELGSDESSIGLALQQIAPCLRTGDPLPASFTVPIVREERKPKLVASYGSSKVA